jgi:hypothetical protein
MSQSIAPPAGFDGSSNPIRLTTEKVTLPTTGASASKTPAETNGSQTSSHVIISLSPHAQAVLSNARLAPGLGGTDGPGSNDEHSLNTASSKSNTDPVHSASPMTTATSDLVAASQYGSPAIQTASKTLGLKYANTITLTGNGTSAIGLFYPGKMPSHRGPIS